MARKAAASKYLLLHVHDLAAVSKDREYAPEEDSKEGHLLDELQCSIADELLIALRKSFSLTFVNNPYESDPQAIIVEIRRLITAALLEFAEILAELGLSPIQSATTAPTVVDTPGRIKVSTVAVAIARTADIDIVVKFNGKKRRLLHVAKHDDADSLFRLARQIVTETFAEVYDDNQRVDMLEGIRESIWPKIASFNNYLDQLGVEPVAMRAEDFPDAADIVVVN